MVEMLSYTLYKAIKHVSGGRHSVYAVAVDKRGRILAEAGNSYVCTHTLQHRYAKACGKFGKDFLHAEIAVITSLARQRKVCHTLYVARAHADGSPANAMPCCICAMALQIAGITNIVWTEG